VVSLEPTDQTRALVALNWAYRNKPMYEGTVDPGEVQRRRTKNRAARRARRITRRSR
jgi:hypothetical protein